MTAMDYLTVYNFLQFICGAIIFRILFVYQIQQWRLRKFRGPMAIPLLGNIYNAEPLSMMKYFAKLKRQFGKIFVFVAFQKPMLVVSDPLVVRRILSDTKTFTKGEDYTTIFSLIFGDGLVTSVGEKHRKDRSLFGKYFIRSSVSKFTGCMNNVSVSSHTDLLEDKLGKPMNIEKYFAVLALRTFMQFSCHSDLSDRPEFELQLTRDVSKGSKVVGDMIVLNCLPTWMMPSSLAVLKKLRTSLIDDTMIPLLEKRRRAMQNGEERIDDCFQAMIDSDMSQVDMEDHFISMVCAGHDTTTFFSAYMAYMLATHPDVQEKLLQEIETQMGDRTELTNDDVVEMTYMTKVMHETLRLFAVIPQVSRCATTDVTVETSNNKSEITIPKGTGLLIPLFLMNRDPEVWTNPNEFNPSRFDNTELNFTAAKNGFFPFGYGSRTCIGNTLAQIESVVFLCHLLRKYRLEPDASFCPKINSGISLTTSNGVWVQLTPRAPESTPETC